MKSDFTQFIADSITLRYYKDSKPVFESEDRSSLTFTSKCLRLLT